MTAGAARAALRREVSMCAAAARAERGFFAGLEGPAFWSGFTTTRAGWPR